MRALGRRLAGLLRAGDLLVLSGELGAGKTTLVQGIGAGLRVRGPVTSPTFVIARVHPSLAGGPDLVHADAYRLASPAEVDDLDLDASLDTSVTVVEWGGGLADGLAADRLEVTIIPAGTGDGGVGTMGSGVGTMGSGVGTMGSETGTVGSGTGPADDAAEAVYGAAVAAGDDRRPRLVRLEGHGDRWLATDPGRLGLDGQAAAAGLRRCG
jgi:tRNA threonylcarbamoyladenosine biosynthesis protein TsaE